jgi:NADPH-dependent 2,4-dienoyl-CoA reductase/sulfur reductase-like enzyme
VRERCESSEAFETGQLHHARPYGAPQSGTRNEIELVQSQLAVWRRSGRAPAARPTGELDPARGAQAVAPPIERDAVCVRWFAGYPLSLRNLEETVTERSVLVDGLRPLERLPYRLDSPRQEADAAVDRSLGATSLRKHVHTPYVIRASRPDQNLYLLAGNSQMIEDVLVIGGGPAGAACALWAHQLGMRVLLLEAAPVVGGLQLRSPYENRWIPGLQGRTGQEVAASLQTHLDAAGVPYEVNFNVASILRRAERVCWEVSSGCATHQAVSEQRSHVDWTPVGMLARSDDQGARIAGW